MHVQFHPSKLGQSKILAFADVTLSEGITVRGFRIVNGVNGLFVAVPSRAISVEGKQRFWNQVQFVSTEVRDRFMGELLERYGEWQDSGASPPSSGTSVRATQA